MRYPGSWTFGGWESSLWLYYSVGSNPIVVVVAVLNILVTEMDYVLQPLLSDIAPKVFTSRSLLSANHRGMICLFSGASSHRTNNRVDVRLSAPSSQL